jgi:hypothetical protein
MSSTILRGADLHRANLRSVDFRKADLSGADLSYAKMQHSNLTGAHLSGADLSYANLSGANVATSQLQTATLCHTTLPDGSSDTSGCAGSSPSPSPKPSAHAVTITQFSVQSTIDCSTSTTVVAKYATTNATSVEFTINGQSPGASAGYDPSGGKAHLPFPCKKHNNAGRKATFAITASGKHKATATKSVTVTATG